MPVINYSKELTKIKIAQDPDSWQASTQRKLDDIKSKEAAQRELQQGDISKELENFWTDKEGVVHKPAYPFKPFIQIKLLSDVIKNKLDYGENIFQIPYNFVTNFSMSTFPFAKCQITLADQEFKNIETFALRALTLYNETILKRQQGYWERDAFSAPGFAQVRWGWEGVNAPVSSNWITMILTNFRYNITGTWLNISLDMIGNSQYFFEVTKVGHKTGIIKPENENATLKEYVETKLLEFGLYNNIHYIIPDEFDRPYTSSKAFMAAVRPHLKTDTPLLTFITQALQLQLLSPKYNVASSDPEKKPPASVEIGIGEPKGMAKDGQRAFDKHGLVKKWSLKKTLEQRKVVRIYEWRDTPTSVVQSIEAEIPQGYFLGYASLSFMGFTLDDNGNVAEHVVELTTDPNKPDAGTYVVSKSTLDERVQTTGDKERAISKTGIKDDRRDERLVEAQRQMNVKPLSSDQVNKRYNDFLWGPHIKKDENKEPLLEDGQYTLVADTEKEMEAVTAEWELVNNFTDDLEKRAANQNELARQEKVAGKKAIGEEWDTYVREHSQFKPIPLNVTGTNGEPIDEKAQRDKWLVESLLANINDDMVLTLRLTVIGDPWLDGVRINFSEDRVRVIVNRPDGKPSLLTNYYLFKPTDVTHSISRNGYTTTMTLMTAKDAQARQTKISAAQQE